MTAFITAVVEKAGHGGCNGIPQARVNTLSGEAQ